MTEPGGKVGDRPSEILGAYLSPQTRPIHG
jgi:hypothetical protein